jgi:ABC-type branched-subunit amino acid transport system ATPase component
MRGRVRAGSAVAFRTAEERRAPGVLIDAVTVRFGGLVALDGITLRIPPGETVGLVGPNGSGKTTLINAICGLVPITTGSIRIGDQDVSRRPAVARIGLGVVRTFQSLAVLADLTVIENVMLGAELARSRSIGGTPQLRARSALRVLGIERYANELGGSLPTGIARRVELARSLVLRPEVLLLDEFTSGLDHRETLALVAVVRRLTASSRITTLVVEHDLEVVVSMCQRLFVLSAGSVMAEGTPREVLTQPEVVAAYVGDTFAAQLALREIDQGEPQLQQRAVTPGAQVGEDL